MKQQTFNEMTLAELKDFLFYSVVKNDKTMEIMVKQAINDILNQ